MAASLYIHIPFCRRRCIYCDFYSVVYEDSLARRYVDSILKQAEGITDRFLTVYVGGGTPTCLSVELFSRLLKGLRGRAAGGCEFTVEANPESLDREKLAAMSGLGVNRLSIGVQSLKEEKLKKLGRVHNADKAKEAVALAAKSGFSNISVDLIFGVWGEDAGSWKRELEEAVKMPVAHVSAYALTYEKATPLADALKNKSLTPLEDDDVARMYETAINILGLRGFKQYEVSNFAREGFECRHNLNYWENNPYTGLGASAVSYADGVRTRNISNAAEYADRVLGGRGLIESSEKLPPPKRAKETAAVKIRTKEGVDFDWFRQKTGFDFMELEARAVEKLMREDLIKYKRQDNMPSGIALKRKGFLFCDTVSSALL